MTDMWPHDLLVPRDVTIHYAARNRSGGAATNGQEQVFATRAARWEVEFSRIRIASAAEAQLFNGMAVRLEGRLNAVLVPFCLGPRPYPGGVYEAAEVVPHDDDTFFDDETGYTQPVIIAEVGADAALGATTISIDLISEGDLSVGQFFSIGERAYQIRSIDEDTGDVDIRPPLREAAAAGTELNFDRPHCRMRLAEDDGMAATLELHRLASPSVRFVEDLT